MNKRIQKIKEKLNCLSLNETKIFKDFKKFNYHPKNSKELEKILILKAKQNDTNLNDINVSDLEYLADFTNVSPFYEKRNFFVDEWDVSRCRFFGRLFENCFEFNCDLSSWDVSNSNGFSEMFSLCEKFNQPILNFDVSNAELFYFMFYGCSSFNQELYNFKFNIFANDFSNFFSGCWAFNRDISMWDVSNVKIFNYMFENTKSFKQDLSMWDVSSAENWNDVFTGSLMEKYPELMPEKFRKDYLK